LLSAQRVLLSIYSIGLRVQLVEPFFSEGTVHFFMWHPPV